MTATLVILAAGLGSRFGGLKQVTSLGPSGAPLMDYSIYDAGRAGFGRVVLVVRPEMAEWARERQPTSDGLPTEVVFQRQEDLPAGFTVPAGRRKPWGTTHAVLTAREVVRGPFAVLNADDFYGRPAFVAAAAFLASTDPTAATHALIGYRLDGTLSDAGGVSRALLESTPDGTLTSITELHNLRRDYADLARGERQGMPILVPGEALVSMNCWVFSPAIFDTLQLGLERFLHAGPAPEAECYLPEVVQRAVGEGTVRVTVLNPGSHWCGVTYPDDAAGVRAHLTALTVAGEYPAQL